MQQDAVTKDTQTTRTTGEPDVGEDDFWCGVAGRGAWLEKEMGKDETNKDSMSTLIREKQKAGNPTRVKGNGRKRRKPPGNAQKQQPIRL